jgi:hypothetical protein
VGGLQTGQVIGGLLAAALLACAPTTAQDTPPQRVGRLAPPAGVACDRNQLTSWTGVVTDYRRGVESTWIEIHTDAETIERTEIDHAGQADAAAYYLFRGEAFSADAWPKIERSPGRLVEGMRATAWICLDDQTSAVIDWQPRPD